MAEETLARPPTVGKTGRGRGPGSREKHGLHRSPEYRSWDAMKARCENPAHESFLLYGGRNIRVCPEWSRSFTSFYRDLGPKPGPGYSLERVDNDQGYEPGNVRWATPAEQAVNKRTSVKLTAFGKTLTVAEWARELDLCDETIRARVHAGLPPEEALSRGKAPYGRLASTRRGGRAKADGVRNHVVVAFGRTQTLAEWSAESGIAASTIRGRLAKGWLAEDAVSFAPSLVRPHKS